MKRSLLPASVLSLFMAINGSAAAAQPPRAKKVPHRLEKHGHARVDDYFWLKDRKNPEVLKYLADENAYTDAALKHTEKFQAQLF